MSTQAFAVYKICQHASSGISFAYSGYIDLFWQLGILSALALAGGAGFAWADLAHRRQSDSDKAGAEAERSSIVREDSEAKSEKVSSQG